jgi:hypothetical protein
VAAFRARLGAEGYVLEAIGPQRLRVRTDEPDGDRLFELAGSCGATLSELVLERSSLEDVFLETLASGGDGVGEASQGASGSPVAATGTGTGKGRGES